VAAAQEGAGRVAAPGGTERSHLLTCWRSKLFLNWLGPPRSIPNEPPQRLVLNSRLKFALSAF